mmetsp:Transcript_35546/g.41468  ORF Transcript_35546/g.41468 Transcript_35546/m.41468 type:complete len:310 (-) Transcript_35546:106-1035(-)
MSSSDLLDDLDFGGSPKHEKSSGFASSSDFDETDDDQLKTEASLQSLQENRGALYAGTGYQLSTKNYADPSGMPRSYYFVTKTGAPFPSYHHNPEAFFPPRWTSVRDAKIPIENLTAPRVRLAPKELEERYVLYREMAYTALRRQATEVTPKVRVLNLSHQLLGDPYQLAALKATLSLNCNGLEVLSLTDNDISDLTELPIQSVKKLYLEQNSISSFLQIPPLPHCTELILTNNFITSLVGLEAERFPKLLKICVHGNPICTDLAHRWKIVKLLPQLKFVDWFSRARIEAGRRIKATSVNQGNEVDECC